MNFEDKAQERDAQDDVLAKPSSIGTSKQTI